MSNNVLDELFQWADQQPGGNVTTVDIAIATNSMIKNNLVTYAEGKLQYYPRSSSDMHIFPAQFVSGVDSGDRGVSGIKQFFSNKRNSNCPFDCNEVGRLVVTLSNTLTNYSVDVESSNPDFQFSLEPSFDAASGILYGVANDTYITISLCNKQSMTPPK
ncbi:hypothetical protein BCM43_29225 (plasmid) [Bacillus thuringiensis]|uniref:hypothetical protein n=1 Tax=Bacillus thuringiensis TaxID=1428 RepID=UPI00080F5A54|nr:hypothetical protein [Bacillus thuringiensis]ANV74122.1 hypothetical protein BCM43_27010 [Bacillus thuringiensis]ANV74516.1 hypothetical protein BCM43_29225 [Bacillus thuringiensis]